MPQKKTVELAESAVVDLEEILAWYVDQSVPEIGPRLVEEGLEQIERLGDFPESGRIVPELDLASVRELIHPPFRIVYRIGEASIWVIRVWRSERLLTLPVQEKLIPRK